MHPRLCASYSRQQLSTVAQLPGDVIAYWLREGLLVAKAGEALGSGKHRRFGFEAVHITAILAELGRYGITSKGLGAVASSLWRAAALAETHADITEKDALDCEALKRARERYPSRYSPDHRSAAGAGDHKSFEAWLESRTGHVAITTRVFAMESWFTEQRASDFHIRFDLFSKHAFTRKGSGLIIRPAEDGGSSVTLRDLADGHCHGLEALPSFITLPIFPLVDRAWSRLEA